MKNLFYFLYLLPFLVMAQAPTLMDDVQQKGNSYNRYSANVNGQIFFNAINSTNGAELWKTDGTAAGTSIVKDIYAGIYSSSPREIVSFNNKAFFSAANGNNALGNGYELWSSDGTDLGTTLIKDIVIGSIGSFPTNLTVVGSNLFFSINDGSQISLYKTDGTAANTVLVANFFSVNANKNINNFTAVGNTLFISFSDYTNNVTELWKSDGTGAGTVIVKSFSVVGRFRSPISFNGNLFFGASDNGLGSEALWKSDGTTAGTVKVFDAQGLFKIEQVGSSLYFDSYSGIYKTDGTGAGTVLVSNLQPYFMKSIGGNLYFLRTNSLVNEFWKTDGTNTVLLKSFQKSPNFTYDNPFIEVTTNGTIFFNPENYDTGLELWKTDGTATSTVLVKDIRYANYGSNPKFGGIKGNSIIFFANNGINGIEPWISDGTTAGTTLIKDIQANAFDSYPNNFTQLGNYLIYSANSNDELGVVHSKLLPNGANQRLTYYNASNFLAFGNNVYLSATNGTGNELYTTNGSSISLVKEINTVFNGGGSNPDDLTALGSFFLFSANDGIHGRELWKSNGTEAGTALLADLNLGSASSSPRSLIVVGSYIYFIVKNASNQEEVWRTDGTILTRITTGATTLYPFTSLEVLNNEIYLTGKSAASATDYELWKINGTTLTLSLVKDINVGSAASFPGYFKTVGGLMYFVARTTANGYELWKTDGTSAGTTLVKDIFSGISDSNPAWFYSFNNTLFFSATDGINGVELWKSDGTTAGTVLLKDINPSGDSNPLSFCQIGSAVYFGAEDGKYGRELWKTDGTTDGTVLVYDLYTDVGNNVYDSNPTNLFNHNGTLFFSANAGTAGIEPYYFKPCTSQTHYPQSLMPAQTLHSTQTILANNTFYPNISVNYFAGQYLQFSPGFSVSSKDAPTPQSNVFRAEVRGCN
jgi:trimeric autotransporter adhesin